VVRLVANECRRWRRAVLLAASLAGAGCLPALYKGHMTRAADGWSIEVRAVTDSLTSVQISGEPTYAVPPTGYHWVWVFMNVRNATTAPRVFGYDSCELPLEEGAMRPTFAGSVLTLYDDHQEQYQPGEESYRRVIFAFPDGRVPTTFRCGNVFFEIPPRGSG
jgi:hypothetical protein